MADAELRRLLDKQACTDLVYKLARAIDRCDEDLLRALFHDDATDDHGVFHGTARDFIPWVLEVLATMRRTQHCICNVLIEVDGDVAYGDVAYGESYFIAHHCLPGEGGDQFMVAAGRYLDRFERRDGAWKFAHRQACYDWNAAVPSTDSWDRENPGAWVFGQRGSGDKSYEYLKGSS